MFPAHTNRRPLITICGESEVITAGPAGIIIVSTEVRTGRVQRTSDCTALTVTTNMMAEPGGINKINYILKLFWAQTGLELRHVL